MIRRPPRSTLDRSSAASDVYKRQVKDRVASIQALGKTNLKDTAIVDQSFAKLVTQPQWDSASGIRTVSSTHLRAHETVLDIVCRLLLENKKQPHAKTHYRPTANTPRHTLS